MKKISNIDFADSSFRNLEADNNNLIVYLNSWDDKTIKIEFLDMLQFIFKSGSYVADLYENEEGGSFFCEALKRNYAEIPKNHPYKKFSLLDIEDFEIIEVVAHQVIISKKN